ncbi:MAG: ribosomal-processing cysteine protease Prp [Bacillota bacterium]|nr:ribosomal-processing cysteine protease Prp [Bacillota bacterium]
MIRVQASRRDGDIVRITASGHAGYDKAGRDIVCAGVTAIMTTIYSALTDLLAVRPEASFAEGWLEIDLRAVHGKQEVANRNEISARTWIQAQLLMETCLLGLRQLAESYGHWIELGAEETL